MADSAKVIHDTIYVKGADALDYLNKTNEFYNNSWDKLILFLSIGGAIVGVIIPLAINYWQQKTLTLQRNKLKKELIKEADMLLKKEIKTLDERFTDFQLKAEAGILFVQGAGAMNAKNYKQAFGDFMRAFQNWCTVKSSDNLGICIYNLNKVIPTISAKDVREIEQARKVNFIELMNIAKEIVDSLIVDQIEMAITSYNDKMAI